MAWIKLVAADMDGTLLDKERKITQYTQNTIRKAVKAGVEFIPATGRAVNALPPELKAMKEVRYGIFSNGATVYDLWENKVIYRHHFEIKRVLELIQFLRQFDLMISVSMNGQSYGERKAMENIDYYELDENTREIIVGSRKVIENLEEHLKDRNDTVEKMTLVFRSMEERKNVWMALSQIEDVQFSSSLPKNIEISPKGCNKGDGLLHLLEALGVKKEETMACGDADNDKEMLEISGKAVVMENGLESMKAIADYITVSNQEDGVAKAMEKFISLDETP